MTSSIPPAHRPIKDLPRSFGSKRRAHPDPAQYSRSESHSRTPSRDAGSNPNISDPESTNSISAPSTPPPTALDSLPMITIEYPKPEEIANAEPQEINAKSFKFTNLPRLGRTDLLMDPLAAARVVLNYSTRAQQVLSQQAQSLTSATSTLQKASVADQMTDYTALYKSINDSIKVGQSDPLQSTGSQPLSPSSAPPQSQNAFSMARMQAQQDDEECGPELTVYEHSVNKKKRKSGRVTYMDSSGAGTDGYRSTGKGDCSWYCGDDADYPQDEEPNADFANGAPDDYVQEQEAPPPPPRMIYPPPHLSHSARLLRRMRQTVSAKVRFERFQRREKAAAAALEASQANANGGPNGEAGKDGKTDPAAEKKPQRRATKAESRAKVRGGGNQKISLAALKAKLAEEQQGAGAGDAAATGAKPGQGKGSGVKGTDKGGPALDQVPEETARSLTPPPRERTPVRLPTCEFTFTRASPIASRLVAMRAEVEMLQSKLTDSLRPVDEAVAAAADVLTRMDAGEDVANAHIEAAAALTAARTNLQAIPSPSAVAGMGRKGLLSAETSTLSQVPVPPPAPIVERAPVPPSVEPQPARVSSAVPEQVSQPPPATTTPPQAPKISRRKKANMNNIHHRTNYVPSRMPSDPPPVARGPTKNVSAVTNWEQPPGLDHPTTTCSLFANEWLCLFCEYELLYGELPSMVRACRRRKKLVGSRKRAQDRAHRAAGGEVAETDGVEQGSQSTDKKKKKGKKKGTKADHAHECCTCTCGKENPAEWEPNAPFNHAATAPAVHDHHHAIADEAHADGAYTHEQHGEDDCDTCRAGVIEEISSEDHVELPVAPTSPLVT